jgi:hypothetical protein
LQWRHSAPNDYFFFEFFMFLRAFFFFTFYLLQGKLNRVPFAMRLTTNRIRCSVLSAGSTCPPPPPSIRGIVPTHAVHCVNGVIRDQQPLYISWVTLTNSDGFDHEKQMGWLEWVDEWKSTLSRSPCTTAAIDRLHVCVTVTYR